MTNRQFSSAPVTVLVSGAPAPEPCLPAARPPRRLDAGAVSAALARPAARPEAPPRRAAAPSARAREFVLAELHRAYEPEVLRAALRTVLRAPAAAGASPPGTPDDTLWQRTADGPAALDRVLAELGRSLAGGPRLRAVLVEDRGGGGERRDAADRDGRPRLFVGLAPGPPERAAALLEELREALAQPPEPVTVPTSALQREMLRQVLGPADHDGRHVEQLSWNWHGPLDTERFAAAWQSVTDHETVLRAAFDWDEDGTGDPWMVLHERAAPDVTRHPHGTADWDELLAADRRRGFDLRRPALLRATLLDAPPDADEGPATRVLLSYHQAMLDGWSVRLLLQSFYRAYLTGGVLPGGERRPDLRDHARWVRAQGTDAPRQFWSTRPGGTAVLPLAPDPSRRGSGRARRRLTPYEAVRLRGWAAAWGAGESSALQAAWALLLYRATQSDRLRRPAKAVRVGFAVTVSGRGIPLDGIDRLPGALRNPLPISVRLHPGTTVPQLLAALRDGVLDLAAYEWVSPGQAHRWTAGSRGQRPNSLVVLEHQPPASHHLRLETDLAAHGIHVESPVPAAGTFTSYPITLAAHYDATGGLVLTATHDRALLADRDALELLSQSAHLLRAFPDLPSGLSTTEVLRSTLAGQPTPRLGEPGSDPADGSVGPGGSGDTGVSPGADDAPAVRLDLLHRATRPGAGWVLLLPPPGAPHDRYPGAARRWPGPQALAVLRPAGGGAPPAAYRPVLAPLLESRAPVALVAPPGLGVTAYEIARLGAATHPPLVVLLDEEDDLTVLAGLLAAAPRR
ncbi:condensation domain-containing protein [Streptomyces sp. NRRL S-350]|uniref:condensation domain-containing protein n=1 Tax=Streptomyces sp. NRRL S-350 TaxID=1463902 RepID=UPI000690C23D|nr:condensation domain-containing protein [Streptomyces sp. NRRL S-350]